MLGTFIQCLLQVILFFLLLGAAVKIKRPRAITILLLLFSHIDCVHFINLQNVIVNEKIHVVKFIFGIGVVNSRVNFHNEIFFASFGVKAKDL